MEEKKNNRLKTNLQNSDFTLKGECAINLIKTKLDIIGLELSTKMGRTVIQQRYGRLKTYESTCKKLKKKGLEKSFTIALQRIHDLIGVRAICAYTDDIYRIVEMFENQKDVKVVKVKDYIREPKESGYRSIHLILEVPITFQEGTQWVKAELQLRTAAMEYWASLDHQLRYKRGQEEAKMIDQELKDCAHEVAALDQRMLEIRRKIERIE